MPRQSFFWLSQDYVCSSQVVKRIRQTRLASCQKNELSFPYAGTVLQNELAQPEANIFLSINMSLIISMQNKNKKLWIDGVGIKCANKVQHIFR
jgi:hypothetical protein